MTTDALYETDLVLWTERQADALRSAARTGSNLPLDWENLAEEIESVGRSEQREIRTLVGQIVSHLLKLAVSPAIRPRAGWESEVDAARNLLRLCLETSPSLKARFGEVVGEELPRARRAAARSLRKYGEDEAAAKAEGEPFVIRPEDVLDENFYLPGTEFRREPD